LDRLFWVGGKRLHDGGSCRVLHPASSVANAARKYAVLHYLLRAAILFTIHLFCGCRLTFKGTRRTHGKIAIPKVKTVKEKQAAVTACMNIPHPVRVQVRHK
jgi:hypothetical protein